MSILAYCKKVFKKNITVIFFGAVLLIFNIPHVYGAGFYGGEGFQINTYTASFQILPSATFLSNGNFVVSWHSDGQDGSECGVYAQIFDTTGVKIGNEFRVNTYTDGFQHQPSVALLNNGNFVVVWTSNGQDQDGSVDGIYAQLFNASGDKVGSEFQVNTYTNSYQKDPSVVVLNDGNFVVAWHSTGQDGHSWGVFAQIFNASGVKVDNEFQINTYTNDQQADPVVGPLNNGNFVVVWHSYGQDGLENGIYAQILDASGSKVGIEFQVNTYITDDQIYPSVTTLTNGNFVVAWQSADQDGDNWGIFAQIFNASGTKIGGEFQVNTYTANSQFNPSVTALSDSNFIVAWNSDSQDGSGNGVYGQVFDAAGVKLGNEFKINDYIANAQECPAVATFSNNNFIVVWSGEGSGDSSGIFGRIFTPNTLPTISGLTKSGTKNTVLTFDKADFIDLFTDADGHSMTQIKILSLPNNGNLKLLSSGVIAEDQEIVTSDIKNLIFDPDRDWIGTTSFGWQGFDGLDYSDAGVVSIDIDSTWLEVSWPYITAAGTALVVIPCAILSAVLVKKAKICCFKKKESSIELNDEGKLVVKEEV